MTNMIDKIRNVYCVGRNYRLHAAELGNAVPTEPMLFTKPTHALTEMNGSIVTLPKDKGSIHYEAELVLYIGSAFKHGITINELVTHLTIGIDLTMRDLQTKIKAEGLPWLPAKGFRNSALVGKFIPISEVESLQNLNFALEKNDHQVQYGMVQDMIFSMQQIIEYCAEHYGLGEGDLIFTGTPAGVGAVTDGDKLVVKLGNLVVGESIIHLR